MYPAHSLVLVLILALCTASIACDTSTLPQPPAEETDTGDTGDTGNTGDTGDTGNNDDTTTTTGDSSCPQGDHFLDLSDVDGAGSGYPAPKVNATCDDTTVTITSNGIPHYAFQQITPNDLQAQDYTFAIPKSPAAAAAISDIPLLGPIAVAVNGIPFYGPNEAGNLNWGDPIADNIVDWCKGHTGAGGTYHYHAALVTCLTLTQQDAQPSPVIGYALDGFPIYGPYGCADADCATITKFESSWETTGTADAAWDNNEFIAKTEAQYLDQCNGRIGPDGTYRYHITSTFPYVLGCYRGTATTTGGGGNNQNGGNNGNGDQGGNNQNGPASCEEESDCVGQCPAEAKGCTCHQNPRGEKICVPTCDTNADCPQGPAGQLTCNVAEGICVPAGGPP